MSENASTGSVFLVRFLQLMIFTLIAILLAIPVCIVLGFLDIL